MSTIDLFPAGFTLITEAPDWAQLGKQTSNALDVPVVGLACFRNAPNSNAPNHEAGLASPRFMVLLYSMTNDFIVTLGG